MTSAMGTPIMALVNALLALLGYCFLCLNTGKSPQAAWRYRS
jgi:hypothetical protein